MAFRLPEKERRRTKHRGHGIQSEDLPFLLILSDGREGVLKIGELWP